MRVVPGVQGTLEVVFYCERQEEEEAIYKQALHAAPGTHLESVSSDRRRVRHRGDTLASGYTVQYYTTTATMSDQNKQQHSVRENQTRMRISTITALARAIQDQSVSGKKYPRNYNNGKLICSYTVNSSSKTFI